MLKIICAGSFSDASNDDAPLDAIFALAGLRENYSFVIYNGYVIQRVKRNRYRSERKDGKWTRSRSSPLRALMIAGK